MLGTEPLSSVVISFASKFGALSFSPSTVVFDHTTWNANVSVSVQAVDDDVDQGSSHGDVILVRVLTEDSLFDCLEADRPHCGLAAKYKNFFVPSLNATVVDDDVAGVAVSAKSANASFDNFGDAFGLADYSLSLATKPHGDVVIATSGLGPYSAATPSAVTFTSATWNVPQTILVACTAPSALRPACASGSRTCDAMVGRDETIAHSTSSSDPLFDGLSVSEVAIGVAVVLDETDPPKVTEGIFSDLLNSILVTFDQSTDRAELAGAFDCALVVDLTEDEIESLFGTSSYCSFTSGTVLKITFGESATVEPGDSVTIKDLTVQSSLASASLFATGQTFAVGQPRTATVPDVALSASSARVGRCDDLVLDGSSTSGSGGRDLTYSYSVMANSGGPVTNTSLVLDLANAANSGAGSFRVRVESAAMVPGSTFTVALQATNFLGNSGSASVVIAKLAVPTPTIKIQGTNPASTTTSDAVSLQVSAELPSFSCVTQTLASSKMIFQWAELTGKFNGALAGTSKNPRILDVPAGALVTHETYTFAVVGKNNGFIHSWPHTHPIRGATLS